MPDAAQVLLAAVLLAIALAIVIYLNQRRNKGEIVFNEPFTIRFANRQRSKAVYVPHGASPQSIQTQLNLPKAQDTIFVIGGAAGMSQDDIMRTQKLVDVICGFAQKRKIVIITGGTESGIMQMFGDSRIRGRLTFPLVGIAPLAQVRFPGYDNPAAEADLEDSHSHFVLIEGKEWGAESALIQELAKCVAGYGAAKIAGILINGGNVALKEIGMAVERGIPMFVVEGSGRTADAVATAVRTGTAEQETLKAILAGGDVQFVKTTDSHDAVVAKLSKHFGA